MSETAHPKPFVFGIYSEVTDVLANNVLRRILVFLNLECVDDSCLPTEVFQQVVSARQKFPYGHTQNKATVIRERRMFLLNLHCKALTVSFGRLEQMRKQEVQYKWRKCLDGWGPVSEWRHAHMYIHIYEFHQEDRRSHQASAVIYQH